MKIVISEQQLRRIISEQTSEQPICDETGCSGTYAGPEFTNAQGDIAHQYSNVITKSVGIKLKQLYKSGTYVKVDLNNIQMSTKGMGTGNVVYKVNIPFIGVSNKCDAMTGFAHVGGWNHVPALDKRKKELLSFIPDGKTENVILDNKLDISGLKKTKEGLQEYWIQWKHKDYQSECGGKVTSVNKDKSTPVSSGNENYDTLTINTSDLTSFIQEVRTKTQGLTVSLGSLKTDITTDDCSFEILYVKPGRKDTSGTCKKIKRFTVALSTQNEGESAADNILNKNPESKVIRKGTFDNGRTWKLIAVM
jgi:hypothetical protein